MCKVFAMIPLRGILCIFISHLDVLLMTNSCLVCSGGNWKSVYVSEPSLHRCKVRTGSVQHMDMIIINNYAENAHFSIIKMSNVIQFIGFCPVTIVMFLC